MLNGHAILLLAVIALSSAVLTVALGHPGSEVSATGSDCRSFTGTPTATFTPEPSPPWMPFYSIYICNDTSGPVSDLHLFLSSHAGNPEPAAAGAGCPAPGYALSGADPPNYTIADVNWGTACVDPGESVYVYFAANCTTPEPGCAVPRLSCFYWTVNGQPVPFVSQAILNPPPCRDARPIPTAPTPTPTLPITPTPPLTPTPRITAAPSPTPTPTPPPTHAPTTTTPTHTAASSTPVLTPAALPRTGAASGEANLMIAWLFAGIALAVAGFFVARRGVTR